MAATPTDKAARFRALHEAPGSFVIPNPWDAGSARILAGLGFLALATSSGAQAGTLGRRDGKVTRDEALARIALAQSCCRVDRVGYFVDEHDRSLRPMQAFVKLDEMAIFGRAEVTIDLVPRCDLMPQRCKADHVPPDEDCLRYLQPALQSARHGVFEARSRLH